MTMGLAALMLAGCSSDDIVSDGGQGGATSNVKGYVGLSIAMPGKAGSRAESDYDEGTTDEYRVQDLTLILFDGKSTEGTSTIKQVVQFTPAELNWTDDTTDGITTASVLPVVPVAKNEALNVMVLVNSSQLFSVTSCTVERDKITNPGEIKSGTGTAITTKAELMAALQNIDASKMTTQGFFMTSAAINTTGYTSDADMLMKTVQPKGTKELAMADAENNTIFVERGVAKVTLTTTKTNNEFTPENGDKITFDGWALDNTNTVEYPFRKVTGDNGQKNWMTSSVLWTHMTGAQGRYEWAVDPNYATSAVGQLATIPVDSVYKPLASNDNKNPLYCLENTFNVKFMQQDQTTRVVVRAKYIPKGLDTGDNKIGAGEGWYRLGNSSKAYSKKMLLQFIVEQFNALNKANNWKLDEAKNCEITVKNSGGIYDAEHYVIKLTNESSNEISLDKQQQKRLKQALGNLTFFKECYCYYPILIRHFNNDLTPWKGENYITDGTDSNAEKRLGRYGVVRNNSYEINITSVSAPGTPDIPEIPEDPDDVQNYYIQATIKILSWTKRQQDVNL